MYTVQETINSDSSLKYFHLHAKLGAGIGLILVPDDISCSMTLKMSLKPCKGFEIDENESKNNEMGSRRKENHGNDGGLGVFEAQILDPKSRKESRLNQNTYCIPTKKHFHLNPFSGI
jgi:hypothetical protein